MVSWLQGRSSMKEPVWRRAAHFMAEEQKAEKVNIKDREKHFEVMLPVTCVFQAHPAPVSLDITTTEWNRVAGLGHVVSLLC